MENGHNVRKEKSMVSNAKNDVKDWNGGQLNWQEVEDIKVLAGDKQHLLPERKLVLHFDVRNTVLVADSVTNINVEQALNSYLTGVTWGKQTSEGWKWFTDEPSLTAPSSDCITYYKHLEQKLVVIPSDRGTLRRVLGDFTQEKIGEQFFPFFKKHLQLLEWEHSLTDLKLTLTGKEGKLYHYMLPAFFKLIQYLHDSKRDFSVIFRTYGMDAANVLQCFDHSVQGHHPMIRKCIPVSVNRTPGKISRTYDQIQFEEIFNDSGEFKTTQIYSTDRGIYNRLNAVKGASAFVDDFLFWSTNGFDHKAGKPFWVDLNDTSVHHIIFDDNFRSADADSIVDIRMWDDESSTKARSLTQEDSVKFENVCLVQADLLESTENINYFIEKVKMCEENYEKMLLLHHHKPNGLL